MAGNRRLGHHDWGSSALVRPESVPILLLKGGWLSSSHGSAYMFSTGIPSSKRLRHRRRADDRHRRCGLRTGSGRNAPTPMARLEIAGDCPEAGGSVEPVRRDHVPDESAAEVLHSSKTSFGQPRSGGRTHEGIDLMASLGQEVYAVDNGSAVATSDRWPDCAAVGERLGYCPDGRRHVLLLRAPLGVRPRVGTRATR